MKKTILSLMAVSFLMISCGEGTSEETTSENTEAVKEEVEGDASVEEDGAALEEDLVSSIVHKGGAKSQDQIMIENMMATMEEATEYEGFLGHWVGDFGKNKINITLTKIDDDIVEGYSVCAGNFRKITGSVDLSKKMPTFEMDEPGTDQYDGKFEFNIDPTTGHLSGHWTPFKEKGNSAKDYTLKKKEWKYDPSAGEYEGSTAQLTDDFLMNQDEWTLGYMRNEIYARHGYSFKNKDWRYEFEGKDWYMPMGVDIRDVLTDLEVKNIGLIYEYESYYEDYYDEYGR